MSNQRNGADGTYAEYCLASSELLAPLPAGWSHADAAGLPVAGSTAYGGMVDAGGLQDGQTEPDSKCAQDRLQDALADLLTREPVDRTDSCGHPLVQPLLLPLR